MSAHEHEAEPIPGLPAQLPDGEQLLWQGRPRWQTLAVVAFHARKVAVYFGVFIVLRGLFAFGRGADLAAAFADALLVLPLALVGVGLLLGLAWAFAESTVYTITNRRVVMRFGVALPMAFNLPFKQLASADLRKLPRGEGEIALALSGDDNIAYAHLWPHARPWRIARTQPMLRALPDAERVAGILGEAMRAWLATDAGRAAQAATAQRVAPERVVRGLVVEPRERPVLGLQPAEDRS
jgi:hypothetical protein